MRDLLGEQKAASIGSNHTELNASLAALKATLASGALTACPTAETLLKKQISEYESELQQSTKKLPSQDACLHSINAAWAEFRRRQGTASETVAKAEEAAALRSKSRRQLIRDAKTVLSDLETALDQEEFEYDDAHSNRKLARQEVAKQVEKLFQQRAEACKPDKTAEPSKAPATPTPTLGAHPLTPRAANGTAPQATATLPQQTASDPATEQHQPATAEEIEAQRIEAQAAKDWKLEFAAEEEQMPKCPGKPDEQQSALLLRLLTLWQAAKFSTLPRMTFTDLKVEPWFVHRLVGDQIWEACWQERADNITDNMTVPRKLLNIITHVAATMDAELRSQATAELRMAAEKTIADQVEAQRRRDQGKAPRQGVA